jgi:hypothetical protein
MFLAIAENSKLEFTQFNAHAEGTLGRVDGEGLLMTRPRLVIKHSRDAERAFRIFGNGRETLPN